MRSLPNTSTHEKQLESNPRPNGYDPNDLSTGYIYLYCFRLYDPEGMGLNPTQVKLRVKKSENHVKSEQKISKEQTRVAGHW